MRYWVSWISGNYIDEGCTAPGVQFWVSGQMERRKHLPQHFPLLVLEGESEVDVGGGGEKDDCTLCAVIDYDGPVDDLWAKLKEHFPDMEQRFIEEREPDWKPGDRFPGFNGDTRLK